jgi:hypothetical protein
LSAVQQRNMVRDGEWVVLDPATSSSSYANLSTTLNVDTLGVSCVTPPADFRYEWQLFVSFNGATQLIHYNYHGASDGSGLRFRFEPCPVGQFAPLYSIPCAPCAPGTTLLHSCGCVPSHGGSGVSA